jgi:hypothetical protein
MKLLLWDPVCRPSFIPCKLLGFTPGLFNADVSSPDYITSNGRMNWKGYGRTESLRNGGIIPAFAWRD